MLRCTIADMGRWTSRDFMRARSKQAGAVHTRHTHGRQGRYKRLSSFAGVRDGRRHAGNHMQGGLGVKIGGGLFGLRIPRQHQLSHMSKEEYDLEVYGHPNITNPYREHLSEHPDLQSVMMNAPVAMTIVVLLPKVHRRVVRERQAVDLPVAWREVVQEVTSALDVLAAASSSPVSYPVTSEGESGEDVRKQAAPAVEVHWTTLETSVKTRYVRDTDAQSSASLAAHLEATVTALYRTHCTLGKKLKVEGGASSPVSSVAADGKERYLARRNGKRPAAFMGAALKLQGGVLSSSPTTTGASSPSFISSVLAQLTQEAADAAAQTSGARRPPSIESSLSKEEAHDGATMGIAQLIETLSKTEAPLLRVCLRPSAQPALSNSESSSSSPSSSAALGVDARGGPTDTTSAVPRRVLRAEMHLNGEAGVWKLATSPLHELLRWHYCAQDPRAHNHDALPHHRRALPLLLVVDYSTKAVQHPFSSSASASLPAPTLMPRRLSLELEKSGFKLIAETSLLAVSKSLSAWAPAAQWSRYTQSCVSTDAPAHNHDHAACTAV